MLTVTETLQYLAALESEYAKSTSLAKELLKNKFVMA
jgi:hypothetical protein